MSLEWRHTSPTFAMTMPKNSFEYRAREAHGEIMLYQEYRPTREITRRLKLSSWPQVYATAEQWAREVARGD